MNASFHTDTALTDQVSHDLLSKQKIINRAVAAKRKREHRLARLLAHQVMCIYQSVGPHTEILLKRLTEEAL